MKTEELLNILAMTPPPRPRISLLTIGLSMALVFCSLTGIILGYRPDIGALPLSFIFKTLFFTALLLVSLYGLRAAALPLAAVPARDLRGIVVVLLLLAATVVVEFFLTPWNEIRAELIALNVEVCLLTVTAYSAIGATAIIAALRYYAPAKTENAALLAGLTAAAAGALGYSLHCQSDSPFFILMAYGGPCLLITALTGLIAPRFLRW